MNRSNITRAEMQTSWKCEPVSLTKEELEEMPKNVKFFQPSAGVNFEDDCLVRASLLKKVEVGK